MAKLKKEIALLKNLHHKNIVQYMDSCILNEQDVHIYMEFMPGGSIQYLLTQYGAFDEQVIRTFTR